ncbi:MAG: glycosyltransferase family 4 protein [Sideroxydans sp.]|nr:glycosyltransferase family 4 protein [Sideroxydans sp.]
MTVDSVALRDVLVDVTRLLGRFWKGRLPTGVDRVSLAYVEHYGAHARAVIRLGGRSFVVPKRVSEQLFQWILNPSGRLQLAVLLARALLTGWGGQRTSGLFLFNTGHSGLDRDDYPVMLMRMGVKPVFMVHDLIPLTHPEYCRAGERDRHMVRMNNVLRLASAVITNSQASLDELTSFSKRIGLSMPPSVVALLAPGVSRISPGVRPMQAPYFVLLSTIEPRKNHYLLLQLWRSLVCQLGESAPRLVVIGQRGWECENVVDMLERCEQLKGVVFEHSDCTDAELVTYLHHAQALLFPSFAEGYGMPLVEALSLGVPVIASDLAVFKEIAGDIPEYVDPLDGKRWVELISEYNKPDSHIRGAQLQRIGDFKVPTWAEHFAKVDALLEQLNESDSHA